MANENVKPIAIQSKNWIAESMLDLLSVKPLDSITISEITENAGIDRRTFYRHFKTKENVISFYIHKMSQQYEETIKHIQTIDNFSIAKAFFEVCINIKEPLQILYKQNLLHLFLNDLNALFQKYQRQFATPEELQLENGDYILAYHIGGFWNLLIKWLADGCEQSPEKMGEIVERVFSFQQI